MQDDFGIEYSREYGNSCSDVKHVVILLNHKIFYQKKLKKFKLKKKKMDK